MLSKPLTERAVGAEKVFRWRGQEVSRFEGVSDAVFAFSVTLLVVSLEVPKTFDELLAAMRGFLAFGVSFVMLAWVWFRHYRYFRRYGLHDGVTLGLGAALLFVVLFYVYPLKFLFGLLLGQLMGQPIATEGPQAVIHEAQLSQLMVIYGLGFAAVQLIFAALHGHAWRLRVGLDLSPAEASLTLSEMRSDLVNVAVALLSVGVALFGPNAVSWAGLIYFLIAPLQFLMAGWQARRRRRQA